jgi:hypothetical protein
VFVSIDWDFGKRGTTKDKESFPTKEAKGEEKKSEQAGHLKPQRTRRKQGGYRGVAVRE